MSSEEVSTLVQELSLDQESLADLQPTQSEGEINDESTTVTSSSAPLK